MRGGYFGTRPFGVPGRRAFCSVGLAAVCAGGQRPAREPSAQLVASLVFWAPPGLRPPRGLPARSPSVLRASLGASSRSPARPCRPRGGLQSGGAYCLCVAGQAPPPPTGTAARPSVAVCGPVVAVNHQFRMQFPSSLFKH